MTEDALQHEIQDYLDDRMSAEERSAFEERLAADGDLARRVRELRAVSRALRQDAPELPPGFYTRLRSRFEAQHAPARRWFRPLSWETAGLAVAVVLAGVLFVPFVMDRPFERPEARILLEPTEEKPRKNEVVDEVEEVEKEGVDEGRLEEAPAEGLEAEEPSSIDDEDSDWAPVPEEPRERQGRGEPAKTETAPPPVTRHKKADQGVPLQQAPPAGPDRAKREMESRESAAPAPAETDSWIESDLTTKEEAKDELRPQSRAFGYRAAGPTGLALPRGAVEPGAVVEIRSEDQWNRLMGAAGGETLGGVGAYDDTVRLVLVGPREFPVDCARSVVSAAASGYEIRLAALADPPSEPVHGCVFRLPRDGRPVRVVGPADER